MTKEIPLTRGKVAIVDDEDFDALSAFKWHAERSPRVLREDSWYAVRCVTVSVGGTKKLKTIRMHREVLGLGQGDKTQGEHVDGDGLNNQRQNLRRCPSHSLNQANQIRPMPASSSRFRGVSWDRSKKCWISRIKVHQINKFLGLFAREEDAALAYDVAAVHVWGEFARPNFPARKETGAALP